MKIFYLFVVFVTLEVAFTKADDGRFARIVEGIPVLIDDAPYQVAITTKGGPTGFEFMCGGTLIETDLVLTNARCLGGFLGVLTPFTELRVYAGATSLRSISTFSDVKWTKIHKKYEVKNNEVFHYDIGLVKLMSPFNMSETINTIDLRNIPTSEGTSCFVTGWGSIAQTSSHVDHLRRAAVPIYNKAKCEASYREAFGQTLPSGTICAGKEEGGPDPCQQDYGGPLVCHNVLTGIISHGKGCGRSGNPAVYTEVSQYIDWIKENSAAKIFSSTFMLTFILQIILMSLQK